MYIKEGDKVKVLYGGINKKGMKVYKKKGIVKWTDGYLYDVILEKTNEVITVYWNDMQLVKR